MKIEDKKQKLRLEIWDELYQKKLSHRPQGDYNKIPDFKGKEKAANILRKTSEYQDAKTIFVSPDSAQIPVRYNCIIDNKTLIMATPKLENGYLKLNKEAKNHPQEASTKEGAFKYGAKIDKLSKVDLVIEGCVGVDLGGRRIIKKGGYGDREISDLYNKKVINNKTPIATTIHPLHIKNKIPMLKHDCKINMIVSSQSKIYIKS